VSLGISVVIGMARERVYGEGDRGYTVNMMGITQTKVASLAQR
jgi:hypothetical protein